MKTYETLNTYKVMRSAATAALALVVGACASTGASQDVRMQPQAADLWTRTCSHCHNLRAAPEFTAERWSVIVMHMRTRASLTRTEARAIAEYLSSMSRRASASR